ncbi:MAG: hypothetical protein WCD89_27415 [Anaerocolumna sp.]
MHSTLFGVRAYKGRRGKSLLHRTYNGWGNYADHYTHSYANRYTTTCTTGDMILSPDSSMILQETINTVQSGQAIYLKAGTYEYSTTILIAEGKNVTLNAMKKSQWPSNNLITGCLSTENIDSGREDADSFAAKLTCGNGNKFVDCISIYNCDDGWDLYTKSEIGPIVA